MLAHLVEDQGLLVLEIGKDVVARGGVGLGQHGGEAFHASHHEIHVQLDVRVDGLHLLLGHLADGERLQGQLGLHLHGQGDEHHARVVGPQVAQHRGDDPGLLLAQDEEIHQALDVLLVDVGERFEFLHGLVLLLERRRRRRLRRLLLEGDVELAFLVEPAFVLPGLGLFDLGFDVHLGGGLLAQGLHVLPEEPGQRPEEEQQQQQRQQGEEQGDVDLRVLEVVGPAPALVRLVMEARGPEEDLVRGQAVLGHGVDDPAAHELHLPRGPEDELVVDDRHAQLLEDRLHRVADLLHPFDLLGLLGLGGLGALRRPLRPGDGLGLGDAGQDVGGLQPALGRHALLLAVLLHEAHARAGLVLVLDVELHLHVHEGPGVALAQHGVEHVALDLLLGLALDALLLLQQAQVGRVGRGGRPCGQQAAEQRRERDTRFKRHAV